MAKPSAARGGFLVVFVRHAKAGSRTAWEGDDRLRPLTSAGRKQANGLVARLEGVPLERVFSSPYQRCVETVEPLAHARGLDVEPTESLAEGAGLEAFLELVDATARPAAFCAHRDLATDLLNDLVGRKLVKPAAARLEKGSTWVLERRRGRFVSARYLPPP